MASTDRKGDRLPPLPELVADIVGLLGMALLFAGLWWIYPPASLIVCGLILLVLANGKLLTRLLARGRKAE